MDLRTRLDRAVFQLTPTRTRCDLIAVSLSGSRDKIASGLLNPFLSHLKFARDHVPKGGYSFDLKEDGEWFCRGTLERFCRFVATPEVLERVGTIETEIVQIEEAAERAHEASLEGPGENSKSHLLLVLENRKKMLQKEQGMAYARASIAGYDKKNIDDLVSFADAFGAFRLREACISFKELCMEKEKDKLWVEELAALAASAQSQMLSMQSSGIELTSENSTDIPPINTNTASDGHKEQNGGSVNGQGMNNMPWGNYQMPNGWLNHPPPEYMYAFRGPAAGNSGPFQGYHFPGMQFMPPYPHPHVGNEDPENGSTVYDRDLHHSSGKIRRSSSRDIQNDNKHSDSESESDGEESSGKSHRQKRSNKKSSRTVVIRNINYITPKGRHAENDESDSSSVDEDLVDEDGLRKQVEDIVGSFERHQNPNRRHRKHKVGQRRHSHDSHENGSGNVEKNGDNSVDDKKDNENWNAFKDILLKDDSSAQDLDTKRTVLGEGNNRQPLNIVDEYYTVKGNTSSTISALNGLSLDEELARQAKPNAASADPIITNGQDIPVERMGRAENFEGEDAYRPTIRRVQNSNEEFMFSHRGNSEISKADEFSNSAHASATIRSHGVDDWLVVSEYERNAQGKARGLSAVAADDILKSERYNNGHKENRTDMGNSFVDDSVFLTERAPVEQLQNSLVETDISIMSAELYFDSASHEPSNRQKVDNGLSFHEPGDLQMVLGRDSGVENATAVWNPEVEDCDPDINYKNVIEKRNNPEPVKNIEEKLQTKPNGSTRKGLNDKKSKPVRGSLTSSRLDALSRSKRLPTMGKDVIRMSKAEKEEASRKRIEELEIERQKRIAQRSAANGSNITAARPSKTVTKVSTGTLGQLKSSMSQGKQNGTKMQQPRTIMRKI